jgi:hypothetical protein
MKGAERSIWFWGALAILGAAGIEWLLIELALKDTGTYLFERFIWFFPFGLMPMLTALSVVLIWRTKSQRQRKILLRYLAIYLPFTGIPLAVQVYAGLWAQTAAWLVAVPAQILIPFWASRKIQKPEHQEAALAAA